MDQSRKERVKRFSQLTRWALSATAGSEVIFEVFNERHELHCRTTFHEDIQEAILRGVTVSFRAVTRDQSILKKVTVFDEVSPPIGFCFRRV